jgi:hypothetical protein
MAHTEPATRLTETLGDANPLEERIENDFAFHPPKGGQVELYDEIRTAARDFAHLIVNLTPAGREQSSALTRLEEAVFHANAAIARHE